MQQVEEQGMKAGLSREDAPCWSLLVLIILD